VSERRDNVVPAWKWIVLLLAGAAAGFVSPWVAPGAWSAWAQAVVSAALVFVTMLVAAGALGLLRRSATHGKR
jgi:hypothetical protein